MATTKKILVGYDEKTGNNTGDFLAIILKDQNPLLIGLKTNNPYNAGRIVFIGKEISEKDIFARLIDSGSKIGNVNETISILDTYIKQLSNFKIGDILNITKDQETGFRLVKLQK